MKRLLLLAMVSIPCLIAAQQTLYESLLVEGEQREYILYVPESYSGQTAVPLLFNFHGYGSNAEEQMQYGDFRAIADTAGFLIVHPEGLTDLIGMSHFNVDWGLSDVDDVGFTDALIDHLDEGYNIDLNRIYSTGMSNGGFMSYHLACRLNERIAAIASVTGSMSQATLGACSLAHPTPVLQVHGTADGVVPFDGFLFGEDIPEVIEYWTGVNSTEATPVVTEVPDVAADGTTTTRSVYSGGTCGAEVQLYVVENGGHTWPGAPVNIGVTSQDFNASVVVWEFLSRYDLESLACPLSVPAAPPLVFSCSPNPTDGRLEITGNVEPGTELLVVNATGQHVVQQVLGLPPHNLDLSALPVGVYQVVVGGRSRSVMVRR